MKKSKPYNISVNGFTTHRVRLCDKQSLHFAVAPMMSIDGESISPEEEEKEGEYQVDIQGDYLRRTTTSDYLKRTTTTLNGRKPGRRDFYFDQVNISPDWIDRSTFLLGTISIWWRHAADSKYQKDVLRCRAFIFLMCKSLTKGQVVTAITKLGALTDVLLTPQDLLEVVIPDVPLHGSVCAYVVSDTDKRQLILKKTHEDRIPVQRHYLTIPTESSHEQHYCFKCELHSHDVGKIKDNIHNKLIFICKDASGIYQSESRISVEISTRTKVLKAAIKSASKSDNDLTNIKINLKKRNYNYDAGVLRNPNIVEQVNLSFCHDKFYIEIVEPSVYGVECDDQSRWKCTVRALGQIISQDYVSITELEHQTIDGIALQRFSLSQHTEIPASKGVALCQLNLTCNEHAELNEPSKSNIIIYVILSQKITSSLVIPDKITASSDVANKSSKKKQYKHLSASERSDYQKVEIEDCKNQDLTAGEVVECLEWSSSDLSEAWIDAVKEDVEIGSEEWWRGKNSPNTIVKKNQEISLNPYCQNKKNTMNENDKNDEKKNVCDIIGDPLAKDIFTVHYPEDGSTLVVNRGAVLIIKMPLLVPAFKRSGIRAPWTCNVITSSPAIGNIWIVNNTVNESLSAPVTHQAIKLQIITPKSLVDGTYSVGIIKLNNSHGDVRTLNINLVVPPHSRQESWEYRRDYLRCLRASKPIINKQCYSQKYLEGCTTLVDAIGSRFEVPFSGEERLELIYHLDRLNISADVISIVGNQLFGQVTQIDNSIYSLWDGQRVARMLFDVSPEMKKSSVDTLFAEIKILVDGKDTNTKIVLYYSKYKEVQEILPPPKSSLDMKVFPNGTRRILVKHWHNQQHVTVQPSDETLVTIEDMSQFLKTPHQDNTQHSPYHIDLLQYALPDDVRRLLSKKLQKDLPRYGIWYPSVGVLNPTNAPWEHQEYLLPAISKYQPHLPAILEAARLSGKKNRKILHAAEIIIKYSANGIFDVTQTLFLDLDIEQEKKITSKYIKEIDDPVDNLNIEMLSTERLKIRLSSIEAETKSDAKTFHIWQDPEIPTWLRLDHKSFASGAAVFYLSPLFLKDVDAMSGQIRFTCDNGRRIKILYIKVSKKQERICSTI